jgi:sensor histidine kinase YesM
MDNMGKYLDKIFETNIIYHLVFWLVFYFFLVVISQQYYPLATGMLINLIKIFFYSIAVYVNLIILFPKFLAEQKYWQYVLLLCLLILIIVPLESIALYFSTSHGLALRSFVDKNINSIFILTFFVASSSSIYKIINDWFTHQRVKVDLQAQTLKSELKYLKSQVNPHFLFNTLNSLYALTLKKSDLAPEIVLRLSEMMRYMLYECNEKEVTLEKEINYIKNYLELEKLRHGDKFEINLELNGNAEGLKIAPLMFMPFIENSFKHGLNSQIQSGYVNIQINIAEEQIQMNVDNSNPPVMPAMKKRKSGGVGLVNIKRRLQLIYPNQHDLKIEKTPNSFHVSLDIDLSKNIN